MNGSRCLVLIFLLLSGTVCASQSGLERLQALRDSIHQTRTKSTVSQNLTESHSSSSVATQRPLPSLEELPIPDSVMIVSLSVQEKNIRDLLQGLAIQYEMNLILDKDVQGLVSVNFNHIRLKDALSIILSQNGFSYRVDHGAILIEKEKVEAPKPPPVKEKPPLKVEVKEKLLNVDVQNEYLMDVIRALIEKTNHNVVIEKGMDSIKVSLLVRKASLEQTLKMLASSHGLVVRERDHVFTLYSDLDKTKRGNQNGGPWININEADTTISLEAENASLADLVGKIFEQAKLNSMIYGKLDGNITANFQHLPLIEALRHLFRGTSYTTWTQSGVVFVGSHEMQTAENSMLIQLKHMKAEVVLQLLPKNFSRNAQIQLVKAQNGLMLTGSWESLEAISQYVEKIDLPVPQILIEALVVDVDLEKAQSYGVDLFLGDATKVSSSESFFPGVEQVANGRQVTKALRKVGVPDVVNLPKEFVAKINLLEQDKVLKVKARSQIATLNGETAVLTVGQTQYFLLTSETDYNQGDAVTNKTTERFEKVEANSTLTVTPYVTGVKEVTCEIVPDFSEPEGSFDSSVPPTLNKRYVKSSVRLRQGETIVLGGMVKETSNQVLRKLPLLGSIPILGWLFRNQETVQSRSQLLIFVTPTIYYRDEGKVDVDKVLKELENTED